MDKSPTAQNAEELGAFEILMALREGRSTRVYRDSLGKLTVGIGHRVTQADVLEQGDIIPATRVSALFAADAAWALEAARTQAEEAGITAAPFIPALASVNFQLGPHWTRTFPDTWRMILDGAYQRAADALDGTAWQRETPVRVADFQKALRDLPCLRQAEAPPPP